MRDVGRSGVHRGGSDRPIMPTLTIIYNKDVSALSAYKITSIRKDDLSKFSRMGRMDQIYYCGFGIDHRENI